MSQQQLQLKHARIEFPYAKPAARDKIISHIQDIHDPDGSWLRKAWRRTMNIGDFTLPNDAEDPTDLRFAASVSTIHENKVPVTIPDPGKSRQAAGWTALQLYRHRTVGPIDGDLFAVDPRPATLSKALRSDTLDTLASVLWKVTVDPSTQPPELDPELLFTSGQGLAGEDTHSTLLSFNNRGHHRPLPGILGVIKDRYDYLYPNPDFDSSHVVAGIVGATSVEAFTEAWDEAYREPDPVVGARTLLESDAFLRAA